MSTINAIQQQYDQLEAVHAQLMTDLKKLSPDQLSVKVRPDAWSIIQVLHHVKGTEEGTLKYVAKKMKYGGLKRLTWSVGIRVPLMKLINNSSVRFKMPAALSQPDERGSLESIGEEWAELRTRWRTFISAFPESELDKAVFRHPLAGRMGLHHAMDSMITHQNHHILQINRIRKSLKLDNKN